MPNNQFLVDYSKKIGDELKELYKKDILEKGALSELLNQMDNIKRRSDGKFEITIPREKPLLIKNPDHEIITNIEISCDIRGQVNPDGSVDYSNYSIETNFWSSNPDFCYRKGIDSEEIEEQMKKEGEFRRIFLRFHFDMRNQGTKIKEPLFHFHIGGENIDRGCYMWMPRELSEPRIPYPPMDPFLIIDLTLRNFCLRSSYSVIERSQWKNGIERCHDLFQKNFPQLMLHQSFF